MVLALVLMLTGCATDNDWTRGYPPCVTEDAAGPCYWDGQERGNGIGRSFVVEPAGDPAENDDDRVIYIDR